MGGGSSVPAGYAGPDAHGNDGEFDAVDASPPSSRAKSPRRARPRSTKQSTKPTWYRPRVLHGRLPPPRRHRTPAYIPGAHSVSPTRKDPASRSPRRDRLEELEREAVAHDYAATVIQGAYRGRVSRKERKQERKLRNDKAARIQAMYRGHRHRSRNPPRPAKKKPVPATPEDISATKIQAVFRGHKDREKTKELPKDLLIQTVAIPQILKSPTTYTCEDLDMSHLSKIKTRCRDCLKVEISYGQYVDAISRDADAKLSEAARAGHAGCIVELMGRGGDVNAVQAGGGLPLLCAAQAGHILAIKALLDAEAEIDAVDDKGNSALHFALKANKDAATNYLLMQKASPTLLNKAGQSALHVGALNNSCEAIQAYLDIVSDPEIESATRLRPLHFAAKQNSTGAVSMLLRYGAKICLPSDEMKEEGTPLHVAAFEGHYQLLSKLLYGGGEVNSVNKLGETPLHQAAMGGQLDCVTLLLRYRAVIDRASLFGDTALHLASRNGQREVIETLLKNSAMVNQTNKENKTAMDAARDTEQTMCVQLLQDYCPLKSQPALGHRSRSIPASG